MDHRELARRLEAIRDYIGTAAAGITIGAAMILFAPPGIAHALGLDHSGRAALSLAISAAVIWAIARLVRRFIVK